MGVFTTSKARIESTRNEVIIDDRLGVGVSISLQGGRMKKGRGTSTSMMG